MLSMWWLSFPHVTFEIVVSHSKIYYQQINSILIGDTGSKEKTQHNRQSRGYEKQYVSIRSKQSENIVVPSHFVAVYVVSDVK